MMKTYFVYICTLRWHFENSFCQFKQPTICFFFFPVMRFPPAPPIFRGPFHDYSSSYTKIEANMTHFTYHPLCFLTTWQEKTRPFSVLNLFFFFFFWRCYFYLLLMLLFLPSSQNHFWTRHNGRVGVLSKVIS